MVQDSLVEYISSQLKLGVSRDTVKAALVGAGWQVGDVDDTLKKVEVDVKPATMTGAGMGAAAGTGAAGMAGGPAMGGGAKPAEQQSIRVSDLISSSSPSSSRSADSFFSKPSASSSKPVSISGGPTLASVVAGGKTASVKPQADVKAKPMDMGGMQKMNGNEFPAKTKKPMGLIIAIVFVVIFAGLAGYLYFENTSLAAKVTSVSGQSASVTSQIASLNSQVQALNASNTALSAEYATAAATNDDLMTELSFAAIPSGSSTTTAASVSVSGNVEFIKPLYVLTTQYGVTIYIKNSSDPQVTAALKPLMATGTSTPPAPVTLTGTHTAGSPYLTVTEVNGSAVQ
jgi:outer membrane murein-binding lipoprotein Lpp